MMVRNLIYDIGMNNGDDTAYYLALGYSVIAVEAAPNLVVEAEQRFKKNIQNNTLKILNVGLTEGEGFMDFYINKYHSGWSSFQLNLANRGNAGYETVKVKTTTLDQLLKENGVPIYLKVDIEGNDAIVLESLSRCEHKPQYISIELYDIKEIAVLDNLGYSKFKIIDQQSFLPLEIPATREYNIYKKLTAFNTSRNIIVRVMRKLIGASINRLLEQKYKCLFQYDHPLGSSGPFGEYLPGKWHSLEQIREIFLIYKNKFEYSQGNKSNGWWIDIHAQR